MDIKGLYLIPLYEFRFVFVEVGRGEFGVV